MIPVLLLSATLSCAAWLFAATEPWAWRICQALSVLCLVAALAEAHRRRDADPDGRTCLWNWRWGLPFLLLLGFMLVQAANPSHAYSPGDEGLSPLRHIAWLPHSVSRAVSLEAAGRLATCLIIMLTARCMCSSRRTSQGLVGLLLAGGSGMALLVILQRSAAPRPPYEMTGMFVNGSNYAAYANLLLPLALSLGRASQVRAALKGDRSHPGYLLYIIAGLLVVSVLISGSRAGVAIAVGLALGWAVLEALQGLKRGRTLAGAAALLLPLLLVAGLFVLLRADRMGSAPLPFEEGLMGLGGRAAALTGTWQMFLDRWVAGTGAGTFACAFPYYQPPAISSLYFRYAHNDWLEYVAELGVIGAALLAWLVAAVVWLAPEAEVDPAGAGNGGRGRRRHSTWRRYERRGVVLALAGMSAHALVDFPLHIPATLLTASALAGLLNRREQRS